MIRKNDSDGFFDSFVSRHVILYVGQNCNDEEIREYISKCHWSCVITSRRDPGLAAFFSTEDRTVKECLDVSQIPAEPLNRKKLPVLRLFGVQGMQTDTNDMDWLSPTTENTGYDMDAACEMLDRLPNLLNPANPLVMIGADSDIDWQLFAKKLLKLLYLKTTNKTVTMWGMPESVEGENAKILPSVKRLVEEKEFGYFRESLVEVIRPRMQELEEAKAEGYIVPDVEDDIYYQGHRTVGISKSDLHAFKNVGTLLTERTLNAIRPLGREMSRMWFSNFHAASSDGGPQWYGYLRQSDFHLKRSFEDVLFQVVLKMLEGKNITGAHEESRPVILAGHPGSSKSVTLAALAYRIYNERVNPVIFLSKDYFFGGNLSSSFRDLDAAIQKLENKEAPDTRFLIIWDSSAYKSGIDRAKQLLKSLKDVGRRCVLVCSSYDLGFDGNEDAAGYIYNEKSNSFEAKPLAEAQVVDWENCYYVRAVRQMNEKEIAAFWMLAQNYSGISRETIKDCREQLAKENRTEVFEYYYLLISLLRDKLKTGLESEQSRITPYVVKNIRRALDKINQKTQKDKAESAGYQAMVKAILEAGLDPADYLSPSADEEETPEEIQDDALEEKLDNLNLCVALFSRFKLPVPYRLAYTLLVGADSSEQYSADTKELYDLVTTDIPWLYYGEDSNGNFSFRFRNSLEADLYLQNHEYSGEKQIDLLCRIIDIYGQDFRDYGTPDRFFTDSLQSLLRLVGPNSEYFAVRQDQEQEHKRLLKQLNTLIEKLEYLKKYYGVPDEDAGFATIIVTFSREYYGKLWHDMYKTREDTCRWKWDEVNYAPEKYQERIEKLMKAIELAENSSEELQRRIEDNSHNWGDRKHFENQQYSLTVEIALCKMRLEDLVEEYRYCCQDFGVAPREHLINRRVRYMELYRQLIPVIDGNRTNGYAYNALFNAFIRTYEKAKLSPAEKLQYISEIMRVVENCEILGSSIMNRGGRGNDELTRHINKIKDFSVDQKINLDGIIRHRKGEAAVDEAEQMCFDLYDEMLEANNTAAITFICYKELQLPKGTRALDEDALKRVEKVYRFMKEEDNYEAIGNDAHAMAMLIRVAWMKYNKTILSNTPECQLTRLKAQDWADINRMCQQYARIRSNNKEPLIILLYALSELHCSGLSDIGYLKAVDILDSLKEDMFYQRRMWTPFMICDESGVPYKHKGTVLSTNELDNNGFIQVQGVPRNIKRDVGLRFHLRNLGRNRKLPERGEILNDLEVGMGFTCLSVYTESGRQDREAKL